MVLPQRRIGLQGATDNALADGLRDAACCRRVLIAAFF
jgi:hypothetical protein